MHIFIKRKPGRGSYGGILMKVTVFLQGFFMASLLSIIILIAADAESSGKKIPSPNLLKVLAIGIDEITSTYNIEVINTLSIEEQCSAADFDAFALSFEFSEEYYTWIREFINSGKPVMYYGDQLDIAEIQDNVFRRQIFQANFDPEFEKDIKAIYVSQVAGIPFLGIIAYPSGVAIGNKKIYSNIETIDFAAEINNAVVFLETIEQHFFTEATQGEPAAPEKSYFFLQETPLYLNGARVARNTCLTYVTPTLKTSFYSQWDARAFVFFIPEQENVYLLHGRIELGGSHPDQQIIDWTDLASDRLQNLPYDVFPSWLEAATDNSGYKIANYGYQANKFEWEVAKKLFGEPWGKVQAISPAIRLLNYSGHMVVTTNCYSEYWIGAGAHGFVLKSIHYPQKTEL